MDEEVIDYPLSLLGVLRVGPHSRRQPDKPKSFLAGFGRPENRHQGAQKKN
jgi:hypothetical protein